MQAQGERRGCASCGNEVYPRVDPVAIMVVQHPLDDAVLLGRSARPHGTFSCLAGFVSAGETLENAVVREVWEESEVGINPASVRFVASQPWPLGAGAQLMLGCTATADPDRIDIRVDGVEMLEARWASRDEVREALARWPSHTTPKERTQQMREGVLWLPPPLAVAHYMLSHWVNATL